ncbi:MAG: undecaprenyl-diphosphate phosphatase [Clostridiales bacterium]|nr:undecaprenyl-diphosphate phosphatase [Clostridiales bacterium]
MSILTSIFQAIAQALTYILPVSESGHSAIFHDFSGRYTNSCSELTGLIHIGIALGLIIAFYKLFIRLIYEFAGTCKDLFTKQLNFRKIKNSRKFMLCTLIPYIFFLFYLIPINENKNLFQFIDSVSYDGNLLGEGICFIITATLLVITAVVLAKNKKGKPLSLIPAVLTGILIFISIPLPGLSLSAVIICVLIICGVNRKAAFRYFVSISVPVLITIGAVEIANCVTYVKIIPGIIAVVISAVAAFFFSKLLLWLITKNKIKYFSYYCYAIGAIITIIGIVEILVK